MKPLRNLTPNFPLRHFADRLCHEEFAPSVILTTQYQSGDVFHMSSQALSKGRREGSGSWSVVTFAMDPPCNRNRKSALR